ncbi:MAG: winged helix-turn-helix transcriptional regulator [Gemmatimonadota bacterium]
MTKREYGQFCGLVKALELVGERWALLIVRDLLVGPRRFTDLRQGLPRIPTNILSARLKELEHSGIIQRRVLPRPDGSVVYELTEYGKELEPAVIPLARWGAKSLTVPGPNEIVTSSSLVMAMRTTFRPEAARGLSASFELRVGPVTIHMRIVNGELTVGEGELPDADLRIESRPGLKALMSGEVSPKDAIANKTVLLTGDTLLLNRFTEVFRL